MDHTPPKDRLLVDDDKSALGRLAKTAVEAARSEVSVTRSSTVFAEMVQGWSPIILLRSASRVPLEVAS